MAITVAIFVRNPVIESILERMLTKKIGTVVLIDNFHLGLLQPGISIDSLTIQSHDNANIYLVKTGRIKFRVRILPFITKRQIDIPEISLQNVHFFVSKYGTVRNHKQLSTLSQLLKSVNIPALLSDYRDDIQSLVLADTLLAQANMAVIDGKTIIDEMNSDFKTLKDDADAIVKHIHNVSNIKQASKVLEHSTRIYNEANRAYEQSLAAYDAIETHAIQITHTAKTIPTIIAKDVQTIVDDVTHPKQLALDVSIRIVKQLLASPIKKYHRILSGLLTILDNMRETSATDTKHLDSTPAVSYETQSSTQKPNKRENTSSRDISFRIGTFHLSVGYQNTTLFSLQVSNITNKIYRSPTPISFVVTTGDTPITVTGRGSVTMNRYTPYMLRARVEYSGIQARIKSPLSLIDLEHIDTTIQGDVVFELTNATDGTASMTIRASDIQSVPLSDTDVGVEVASFLEGVSPVDITANIGFSDATVSSFSVHDDFTSRLAEVIVSIVDAQLANLRERITKEMTAQITESVEKTLIEAKAQVDDALSSLRVEISSGKALVDLLSNNQNDIHTKVSEMRKEIIRKSAEEASKKISEKIKTMIKDKVDSIKDSLPF